METGPPYLMPLSKNTIQENELSIQIFKGGFSFCTKDKCKFYPLDFHPIEQSDAFAKLLEKDSCLEKEKIKAVFFNQPATFVPKELYNPNNKQTYLNYNIDLDKGLNIAENQTQDEKIQILFSIDDQIQKTLKFYFKDILFSHYTQTLYDLSASSNPLGETVMNLHLQDDQFDLLVNKGEDLLFFNTYSYKNENGFLYFIMAVAEELSLSPESFRIQFFGKYDRYKKYYTALESHHEKISFTQEGEWLLFDGKEHPAPYFINLF